MGIYVYTLRKNPIKTIDMEIAQYAFAFKDGWGASSTAKAQRQLAAGERASDHIGKNRYFVLCSDPKEIGEKKQYSVMQYLRDEDLPSNIDDCLGDWCKPVGHIVRIGRRLEVVWG